MLGRELVRVFTRNTGSSDVIPRRMDPGLDSLGWVKLVSNKINCRGGGEHNVFSPNSTFGTICCQPLGSQHYGVASRFILCLVIIG